VFPAPARAHGRSDTYRITIWDKSDDSKIYDNGNDQLLGGGSIVIRKVK
jgi:hypothetical protein